ncbi:MAG: hypothetical protein AB8B55_23535 [Mariniblastus sp.]
MKHSFASKRFWISSLACSAAWLSLFSIAAPSLGQGYHPNRHELIRGDMPPGMAADLQRMSHPKLEARVQPVRVIGPLGTRIDVAARGGFIQTNSSRVSVGLRIGPVYRLKLTNIPKFEGKELYPSIEVLNKLNPPQGLDHEFPVQIVLTQDDLAQAFEGRLVTKVIYLENGDNALPHRHKEDEQPYFDVGGGEDPLRAARKLGKPMAIVRIGSRIPLPSERVGEFNFYAPEPTVLPDPQTIRAPLDWDAVESLNNVQPLRIPDSNSSTIPGQTRPIPRNNR